MRIIGVPFLLLLALLLSSSEAYRILCLFPFNGKSHFIMFDALCKGLAKRGHQIDMISHFPTKTPTANYTDIVDLSGTRKNVVNSFSVAFAQSLQSWLTYKLATAFGSEICELMGQEPMQKFIKDAPSQPPYDLVITEFFGASCYIGFGMYLKSPIAVALSSMDMPHVQRMLGSPVNNAFYPGLFTGRAALTNFWDRLHNTLHNFYNSQIFLYYSASQTEIMRRYLGQDLPDVREVEKNVSLALVNAHYSFHGIRPITPALVEVGGLHIEADNSDLTPQLKKWMDSAENGVVYFTLGSLVNIETLPEDQILGLYASFKKIAPVSVLMKCGNSTKLPLGLPGNVFTLPWIPQIPVLRHKNTRVFISHGGLMGSLEAMHFGVPMIGIPLFADQMQNVNIFVHKNMAVLLNREEITESSMDAALNAVLNDPKYRTSAIRESKRFRDRPIGPMELAIHSVEYIIRHGPDSLKSPAVDLTWWQLYLIDIFAFLIACFLTILYSLIFLMKILLRKLCRSSAPREKKRN